MRTAFTSVVLVQSWIAAITSSDMIDSTSDRVPSLAVRIFVNVRSRMSNPILSVCYRRLFQSGGAGFPRWDDHRRRGPDVLLHVNTAPNGSFDRLAWDPLDRRATRFVHRCRSPGLFNLSPLRALGEPDVAAPRTMCHVAIGEQRTTQTLGCSRVNAPTCH